jgi:hypothetical protein
VVSFTPRPLYPRKRVPGNHWIRGWVGPRAVLDTAVVKRKIPSPLRESNPRTPIVQPVAQRYTRSPIMLMKLWWPISRHYYSSRLKVLRKPTRHLPRTGLDPSTSVTCHLCAITVTSYRPVSVKPSVSVH